MDNQIENITLRKTTTIINQVHDVLVFKTNAKFKEDAEKIGHALQDMQGIKRWTIDHEDCDKVLRIESININAENIITVVTLSGYLCEEFPE